MRTWDDRQKCNKGQISQVTASDLGWGTVTPPHFPQNICILESFWGDLIPLASHKIRHRRRKGAEISTTLLLVVVYASNMFPCVAEVGQVVPPRMVAVLVSTPRDGVGDSFPLVRVGTAPHVVAKFWYVARVGDAFIWWFNVIGGLIPVKYTAVLLERRYNALNKYCSTSFLLHNSQFPSFQMNKCSFKDCFWETTAIIRVTLFLTVSWLTNHALWPD